MGDAVGVASEFSDEGYKGKFVDGDEEGHEYKGDDGDGGGGDVEGADFGVH